MSVYHRPAIPGELRDRLREGVACEVASDVADLTATILMGCLDFGAFVARPSTNEGWTVFEPAKTKETDT